MNNKVPKEKLAEIRSRYVQLRGDGKGYGAIKQLAREYNVSRWTIQNIISAQKNYAKEFDPVAVDVNEGESLRGRSVLYDSKGKVKLQWVKTDADKSLDAIKALIEDLVLDLPTLPPFPAPRIPDNEDDYLSCYPMGDPHFGMLAWGEEAGEDFDLKIAEADLCDAVDKLVELGRGRHALIANLGDFFHADSMDAKTWRGGHRLDVDSRWLKMLRVGIRAMIRCVHSALRKHEKVTVICAIGNHDDHRSMMLMTVLSHLFADEPRVTIIDEPTIKHYYRFGQVLIGVHHGHTIKKEKLPFQMSVDRKEDWGATSHRYWFTGHIHHDTRMEYDGEVVVESFRTLAAKDAYTAQHGYSSGRDMKCIVMHKDFGEIERYTVSVKRLGHYRR